MTGRLTYNRRITATTPIRITGPAAGDACLKTSADPTGTTVLGMLNNCGGGITPWGTVLTAEENFNQYFANADSAAGRRPAARPPSTATASPTAPASASGRSYYTASTSAQEPNEPFRFGWIVEIDPYDPDSVPKKRTALGRFKHEAAADALRRSGAGRRLHRRRRALRLHLQVRDRGTVNPTNRAANLNLLDEGTLYVARFNDDGTGQWLPLVFGQGPLTAANGFSSRPTC